jgi:hypothetical protein
VFCATAVAVEVVVWAGPPPAFVTPLCVDVACAFASWVVGADWLIPWD